MEKNGNKAKKPKSPQETYCELLLTCAPLFIFSIIGWLLSVLALKLGISKEVIGFIIFCGLFPICYALIWDILIKPRVKDRLLRWMTPERAKYGWWQCYTLCVGTLFGLFKLAVSLLGINGSILMVVLFGEGFVLLGITAIRQKNKYNEYIKTNSENFLTNQMSVSAAEQEKGANSSCEVIKTSIDLFGESTSEARKQIAAIVLAIDQNTKVTKDLVVAVNGVVKAIKEERHTEEPKTAG